MTRDSTNPPGFDALSVEQKIDYVQELWDRISREADRTPLADWQVKLLEDRLKDLERDPSSGIAWPELRAELFASVTKKP